MCVHRCTNSSTFTRFNTYVLWQNYKLCRGARECVFSFVHVAMYVVCACVRSYVGYYLTTIVYFNKHMNPV